MSGIKLISTGSALPVREVTNFDMEKLVETSDEWISTRTGISARRFCSGEECHTSLCLAAARQALERSGLRPEQIGVCLVATLTQDTMTPSTACVLQKELGLPEDTVCFDLNAACAGFVYGLHTAECLLAAASRKYGLVIGCEVLSRITDFTDRSTCVLFGDGAGAAILEWGEDYPSLCAVMGSRGNRQVLMIPGVNSGSPNFIHMDGTDVFRFAVDELPTCANEVAAKAGINQGRHQPGPGGPLCVPPGQPAHPGLRHQKAQDRPCPVRRQHRPHRQYLCRQRPPAAGRAGHIGGPALGPARSVRRLRGRPDLGRRPAAAGLTDAGSPNSPSLFDSLTKELL